ncbi:MAG: hypothetical protein IKE27_02290 [Oscillospiraceae bacterium]|nr:hypothetical protein [Oscillospiraceae bacterium]
MGLLFGCAKKEKGMPLGDSSITELNFIYDGNKLYMYVHAEDISPEGAKVSINKRVGEMNYTGHSHEGDLNISGEQVETLFEIFSRYDLEAWSHLPSRSSISGAARSIVLLDGDDIAYDIMWNARFPETIPPEEDIFYFELFNFFNDLIYYDPDWAEVQSDNLEDPREDPVYSERTVTWFGHERELVPGTGSTGGNNYGAEIDYRDEKWWVVEGFVGSWTMTAEPSRQTMGMGIVSGGPVTQDSSMVQYPSEAVLIIGEDGSIRLEVEDMVWTGTIASSKRYYKNEVGLGLCDPNGGYRSFTVACAYEESFKKIYLSSYPGPVPEPQFTPINITMEKTA